MANSVYKINKGVNKPMVFKGLQAQYIWYLGGGCLVLLILFAVLYILGVNTYVCLMTIMLCGTFLFIRVQRLSHKYGAYGMMKKVAQRGIPKVIKCNSRSVSGFSTILKLKKE